MAAFWHGYRRIIVRDRAFRWRLEEEVNHILVRAEDRPGPALRVLLRGVGIVAPRLAGECIARAMDRGWLEAQADMQFVHDAQQGKA